MSSAPTSSSSAPMTRTLATDTTLAAWLGNRQKQALPRLVAVLVSTVCALAAVPHVPAPFGLVVMALPVFIVVGTGQLVTWRWVQRGRALGLRPDEIAEMRRHLQTLPARVPLYDGDELLALVRAQMPSLLAPKGVALSPES